MTDYEEDTIVQLITELYHLLIKLCTIEEDQVAFPPDGGHRINEELCESLHIDSAVVSLMKRLPYPKKRETQLYFCLLPRGMPLVYIDDRDIMCGRDVENAPFGGIEPLRLDWMLPHDVALTLQNDREGASVILDTKENTVRIYCLMNGPPRAEGDTQERLDDHYHYRNWCHQDAPTYLRDLIDKVKALESIPCGIYPDYLYYDNVTEPEVQQEMKQIVESYGWPDQFRRDEWKSNMEKHWDDAI